MGEWKKGKALNWNERDLNKLWRQMLKQENALTQKWDFWGAIFPRDFKIMLF